MRVGDGGGDLRCDEFVAELFLLSGETSAFFSARVCQASFNSEHFNHLLKGKGTP